jgi:hypothetical protein
MTKRKIYHNGETKSIYFNRCFYEINGLLINKPNLKYIATKRYNEEYEDDERMFVLFKHEKHPSKRFFISIVLDDEINVMVNCNNGILNHSHNTKKEYDLSDYNEMKRSLNETLTELDTSHAAMGDVLNSGMTVGNINQIKEHFVYLYELSGIPESEYEVRGFSIEREKPFISCRIKSKS